MFRYYRSAIFHNWKCLYFCQFLLELLLTMLVRKFFFPAEFVCEVWKGFWCLTVITGLWTNRKKYIFIKFWPRKSLPEGVDAESGWFANWQVFALLFFANMWLLHSTKTLTPLFQPISSRNSIRNVTCLHAFPAFTSRRLVVRSARFTVFLLWNSCCRLKINNV